MQIPRKSEPTAKRLFNLAVRGGAYIERWLDNADSHGKELGKVDLDRTMNIADS